MSCHCAGVRGRRSAPSSRCRATGSGVIEGVVYAVYSICKYRAEVPCGAARSRSQGRSFARARRSRRTEAVMAGPLAAQSAESTRGLVVGAGALLQRPCGSLRLPIPRSRASRCWRILRLPVPVPSRSRARPARARRASRTRTAANSGSSQADVALVRALSAAPGHESPALRAALPSLGRSRRARRRASRGGRSRDGARRAARVTARRRAHSVAPHGGPPRPAAGPRDRPRGAPRGPARGGEAARVATRARLALSARARALARARASRPWPPVAIPSIGAEGRLFSGTADRADNLVAVGSFDGVADAAAPLHAFVREILLPRASRATNGARGFTVGYRSRRAARASRRCAAGRRCSMRDFRRAPTPTAPSGSRRPRGTPPRPRPRTPRRTPPDGPRRSARPSTAPSRPTRRLLTRPRDRASREEPMMSFVPAGHTVRPYHPVRRFVPCVARSPRPLVALAVLAAPQAARATDWDISSTAWVP